jgi:hypothetical protein
MSAARYSCRRRECPDHPNASLGYLDGGWRCVECGTSGAKIEYVEVRRDDWRQLKAENRELRAALERYRERMP